MAAIANTAAELRVSNHVWKKNKNVTGLFQDAGGAPDICPAGFLVKPVSLMPCEGYTGINNEDAWIMQAADTADATGEVYFCNTFDVQELVDGQGNVYKVGAGTLGLPIPAGQRGTYTRIDGIEEHDQIRFGIGNFAATPTVGQYATIAGGMLTPSATAPTATGTLYFEIMSTGNFTAGAYQSFGYVQVRAKRVLA
jgi:hypothetical protein